MKGSMRARRMARNHKRHRGGAKLNLVSLMDIFTILVFFLMVNNGDVEVLQADNKIKLPESMAAQKPDATTLIKVSPTELSLGGETIVLLAQLDAGDSGQIEPLAAALNRQVANRQGLSEQPQQGWAATIMADQEMPYQLLKRVLTTCANQGFRDVSLAVSGGDSPELLDLPTADKES